MVIGGGSLHGGESSVIGTLIGALIMGLLANGSDLLGMPPYLAAGDCRRGNYWRCRCQMAYPENRLPTPSDDGTHNDED